MSNASAFLERVAQRGHVQAVSRVPFGSPANLRLTPTRPAPNSVALALALATRGLSLRDAHAAALALLAGENVALFVPTVEDTAAFAAELADLGVRADMSTAVATLCA